MPNKFVTTMLNFIIPVSLIGSGSFLGYNSWKESENVERQMKNENIVVYGDNNHLSRVSQTGSKYIVKIPNHLMKTKLCGNVSVYGVTKKHVKHTTKKQNYLEFLNELETTIETKHYYFDEKTKIASQLLFPNLCLGNSKCKNPNHFDIKNNTKILFENKLFTKSNDVELLREKFEKMVQKNIPEHKTSFCSGNYNHYELEENLLSSNADLYLLVKPNVHNIHKTNSDIIAISDNPNSIIQEKYADELSLIAGQNAISIFSIGMGIVFIVAMLSNKF